MPNDKSDLADHGVGLAKNKRLAFLAVGLFLSDNGHRLICRQVEAALTMLAVASGTLDERGFAAWLRKHIEKRGSLRHPQQTVSLNARRDEVSSAAFVAVRRARPR